MTIAKYCCEFEKRLSKVKTSGTTLSEPVLAFRLLISANLTEHQESLVRATIAKIDYKSMVLQLKKVVGNQIHFDSIGIKEENEEILPNDTYYGGKYSNRKGNWRNPKEKQQSYYEDYRSLGKERYAEDSSNNHHKVRKFRGRNPIDPYGKITRCRICDSINHWENKCPDKSSEERDTFYEECLNDPYYSDNSEAESITYEVETHNVCLNSDLRDDLAKIICSCDSSNVAILDSGAPKSVCGINWLNKYICSLSPKDKSKVKYRPATSKYKFGCLSTAEAIHKVKFPVAIGDIDILLKADVVEGELPLLLSRSFMKQANSELNFKEDTIKILDQTLNLLTTQSGHYVLPLGRGDCNKNELHISGRSLCKSDERKTSDTVYFTENTECISIEKEVIKKDRIQMIPRNVSINADTNITINNEIPSDRLKQSTKLNLENCNENQVMLSTIKNIQSFHSVNNDSNNPDTSNYLTPCTNTNTDLKSNISVVQEYEEFIPIFVSDGIVGDLNCPEIVSRVFPEKSVNEIMALMKQEFKTLKRDVWLSVGNFLAITLPDSLEDKIEGYKFTRKVTNSLKQSLEEFNSLVKSNGGRLFVIEIFPSPCLLDPDRSKSSARHQKLGWKLFLDLNKAIKDFNINNGIRDTLNLSSYLRSSIKLNKEGKRRYLKKSCLKICSDNGECMKWESKIKKNLHHDDNVHLLESTRLVVTHVIQRAIRKKGVNC